MPQPVHHLLFLERMTPSGNDAEERDMKCARSGLARTWAHNIDDFAALIYASFLVESAECQNFALNI